MLLSPSKLPIAIIGMSIALAAATIGPESATTTSPGTHFNQEDEDYYGDNQIRYENRIYKKNIRTVQLHRKGFELSQPVINLGTDEQLRLAFDDMDEELKEYSYTLIHCDASWQPSDLMTMEFIEGLQDEYINDYGFSTNTLQRYTHYDLYFPSAALKPRLSGNYLIKVYQDSDPDDIVLTWRFMIVDPVVDIVGRARSATTADQRLTHHEVDFSVLWDDRYELTDPYQRVKVVVQQNHRWDNALFELQPRFVKDRELDYQFDGENTFPAGNEYRFFDTRNLNYQAEGTDSIRFKRSERREHVYLEPDPRRAYVAYLSRRDINGKRLVKADGWQNADFDADYAYVHFRLPWEDQALNGDIYVFGALSDWRFTNRTKMRYNKTRKRYECKLYLKQGYYNYEYVFLKDKQRQPDVAYVEGSHYQAENDYTVLVYHLSHGGTHDRLVATATFNSVR